jgi:hypothetical protein
MIKPQTIKLLLVVLLLLCLLKMPYGYYQLVRIIATFLFAYFAYKCYQSKKTLLTFLYFGLTILFQPLIKIALGRTLWNTIDIIVAIFLIVTILPIKNQR